MFEQEISGYRDCMKEAALAANRSGYGGVGFNKFTGSEFDGEEVFQAMRAGFGCAMDKFPQRLGETYYIFGGHLVCIRIVGRQLAQHILQPFSHLRTTTPGQKAPELTIDLWDENDTDIRWYTCAWRIPNHAAIGV